MRKNPNVKLWQFPVQNNRSRFLDGGRGHFELRSAERAAALGYRIEFSSTRLGKITGGRI